MNRWKGQWSPAVAGLAVVFGATPGVAADCECPALQERLRVLEQRVEMLENRLGADTTGRPDAAAGSAPARTTPQSTAPPPAEAERPNAGDAPAPGDGNPSSVAEPELAAPGVAAQALHARQVRAAFYLYEGEGELSPEREPDGAGRIPFEGRVSFQPKDYGLKAGRFFSKYDDPSRYPAMAVHLRGMLELEETGEHTFVLHPKPARQGGSAVRSRMTVRLRIDGNEVAYLRDREQWRPVEETVRLEAGLHEVEVTALAQSPGFGPSPVDSELSLGVRGPEDAAAQPLTLATE